MFVLVIYQIYPNLYELNAMTDITALLGSDYMISVGRDEILSSFAGIPAVL